MTPLIEQIARAVFPLLWKREQYNGVRADPTPYRIGGQYDMGGRVEAYEQQAMDIAQAILPIITAALNARQEQDAAIAENSDCSPSYERSEWYGGYECGFYSACATIATAIRSAPHD